MRLRTRPSGGVQGWACPLLAAGASSWSVRTSPKPAVSSFDPRPFRRGCNSLETSLSATYAANR
jgi:hypothetical protein